MYTISKEFHFSASHQLTHLMDEQPDHPCARNHGHNYIVRIFLSSKELGKNHFVCDYNKLDWFKNIIDTNYDHRFLNDVLGGDSHLTTAENLAQHFFFLAEQWLDSVHQSGRVIWVEAVEVQETPKTCARYSRS
jgi:6-pyruvoyltetrahydropterin/6-carboxytetrahydropterin synthase